MDDERRKLCQAGGLLVASQLLPACGGAAAVCGANSVQTMLKAAAVPMGNSAATGMVNGVATVFLVRDGDGVFALSALCPHQGCYIGAAGASGFVCPCHHATFDLTGETYTAPAQRALTHLALCTDETGQILVDATMSVLPSYRLK